MTSAESQRYHWHSISQYYIWCGTFDHALITQGSFAEITNQRFSLKYQTFWRLGLISYGGKERHTRMVSAKALVSVAVLVFPSSLHPRAEAANGEGMGDTLV